MYLHRMTIQALGPFAGRHTIDFARLGTSGLFLLEGPTGAGKSTLIDAVVFALYGKVASKDASEDRLRSGHAAPADETFVDLVLESRAGIFRVRRTPAYQRPKQRGTGTTTQQATVRLWRLSDPDRPDDGELISARLDEAGPELQQIVGLDRAQFVQTVVLPQGEFAGFLRANPEDRRGLLQKVFGTEVYEQLQQRLERLRAQAGRAVDDTREQLGRTASHYIGAAGLEVEDAALVRAAAEAPGPDAGPLLELVKRLTGVARDQAAQSDRESAVAKEACAATLVELDRVRATAAALERRGALRSELADLESRAGEHAARVGRMSAAQRALAVLPLLTASESADERLQVATQRAAGHRAAAPSDLAELVDARTEVGVQRKTLAVERDRCSAVRGSLARVVELEASLPPRQQVLADVRRACTAAGTRLSALVDQRAARPLERERLVAELDEATGLAEGLDAAEQQVQVLTGRWTALQDALRLAVEVDSAEAVVATASAAARGAVDEVAALQRARIAGMAGELAQRLVPGDPCVVCGGTEHPSPAALDPAHVTTDQLEAAEEARSAAERSLVQAAATLSGLRERLLSRYAAAGDGTETLEQDLTTARARVDVARGGVARRADLETALADLDRDTARLDEQAAALRTELATAEERATGLEAQLDADRREVEDALDGAGSVRERMAAVEARLAVVASWADVLGELEDAKGQQAVRAAELATGLSEHDIADVDELRRTALPRPELAALEASVLRHTAALERVSTALAAPELAGLAEDASVDVPAAEQVHRAADELATQRAQEAARRRARADAATSVSAEVEAAVAAYRAAQAEAGPVVRMANLAAASSGDNSKQLTLATYVLMRRFEDVVAAATQRLTTMSDGRYELVRSDEREAVRTRRTGLAMKVVDHHIGAERDPRTLSGGETFYVSLCLALGLADVVTAEAGGTDLGTLFVDEGFGSLDPETLDVVLAELGRLREGGRVVGVVSHVETLKQSIAERVEVRRLDDGTSTLTVRA